MVIRPACYEDVDRLIEMGARMHGESTYAFLPYDREKVRQLMNSYVAGPDSQCFLVAEQGGKIVGMFGGYLTDYFFCHEKLACDVILFVDREHRGGTAAARLIRAFRQWATERDAREICLGITTGINAERAGMFYERLGLTSAGEVYKQRLEAADSEDRDTPGKSPGGSRGG